MENANYQKGIEDFTSQAEVLQATNAMMREEMAALQEQMGAVDLLAAANKKLHDKVSCLKGKLYKVLTCLLCYLKSALFS